MPKTEREASILRHIVSYCMDIQETVDRFGNSFEIFSTDKAYRNACAMCILQIGELVGLLSSDFKSEHPDIPWIEIKAMRNVMAHEYGNVSIKATWNTIQADIPALQRFCVDVLE